MKSGRRDELRGHELALRPQARLVDEHLAARLVDQPAAHHGSGTQAPSMLPCWNAVSVVAFGVGMIDTSPPPDVSVFRPFVFRYVPGRDVLGVAELRRGDLLALEVARPS